MSYILDALRKSQQARQTGSAPGSRAAVHNVSVTLPGGGWLLALGVILLLGLFVAALLFWRATVSAVPDVTPPAIPVAAPAVNPPAAENAAVTAENPIRSDAPVRDLAEQAQVPVPPVRKKAAPRPAGKVAAAKPRPVISNAAAPATFMAADDTPLLQQMPLEFQRVLSPMAVTIHVYSQDVSQRILFINNREYRQGDRMENGARVEEVVPDGVVLSYQGERFKLSRPR